MEVGGLPEEDFLNLWHGAVGASPQKHFIQAIQMYFRLVGIAVYDLYTFGFKCQLIFIRKAYTLMSEENDTGDSDIVNWLGRTGKPCVEESQSKSTPFRTFCIDRGI
jgi:hypothetical protein